MAGVTDQNAVDKSDVFLVIEFQIEFFPKRISLVGSFELKRLVGICKALFENVLEVGNEVWVLSPIQVLGVRFELLPFACAPQDSVCEPITKFYVRKSEEEFFFVGVSDQTDVRVGND